MEVVSGASVLPELLLKRRKSLVGVRGQAGMTQTEQMLLEKWHQHTAVTNLQFV